MDVKESKILVRARLEGKRYSVIEDALIDTGAALTVIPPVTSDLLELETNKPHQKVRLVTASGLIEVPINILDKLEVAGIEVEKLPVAVHKIPDPAPIKILLGMNFIERIKLKVDGKKGTFDIEDPF
jgi:clan AA aspartic protease (TIGR02281 family)